MPDLRIVAVVALLTGAIVAFVALNSDDEMDGEAPSGYTTYEGNFGGSEFSFAYPAEWGEVSQRQGADSEEAFFEVDGGGSDGAAAIKLGVQADSASPEAILQANLAAAQAQSTDVEVIEERAVQVVGAVEALRADTTYPVAGAKGSTEEFQSVIVVAATADETIFNLILSDRAEAPSLDLEAVAESLWISTPAEGTVGA